jgi:hypothetical protein
MFAVDCIVATICLLLVGAAILHYIDSGLPCKGKGEHEWGHWA